MAGVSSDTLPHALYLFHFFISVTSLSRLWGTVTLLGDPLLMASGKARTGEVENKTCLILL